MWARVIEIMTGVWLALSPFIFRSQSDGPVLMIDMLLALAIATLAGLSYWHPTRHAHLLILFVASGLIVWARFAEDFPPPVHQNHIFVGMFLLMIALIPNNASKPPKIWLERIDA